MNERVIALGFFDGVHLGHAALLRRTVEVARERNGTPAIFTFSSPPKEVVTGIPCPLINSAEDRRELAGRLYHIHDIIMVPFDRQMMTTSWQDFVTELLIKQYHAVHLVAGHDHRFGHKNQGNPELLQKLCQELGLGCDIIPKVELDGVTVSSTHIRQLIEQGNITEANRFLGHPHSLTGTVRHGRGLGSSRLFPTANLVIPDHVLVPRHGVYITRVYLPDGRSWPAVTNVGTRPTVNQGDDVTVEAYILGFDESLNLYSETLRLEFFQYLREEIRFDSLDALKAQIAADAESTQRFFD